MSNNDSRCGHTPGPWIADGFDVECGLTTICTTWPLAHGIEPYGVDNNQIAEANARLIASAPSLLSRVARLEEALKDARATLVIAYDVKHPSVTRIEAALSSSGEG